MTQYHYERPPTAAVESPRAPSPVRPGEIQELRDIIAQQQDQIQGLERTLRRVQNELRQAVQAFNGQRRG